MTEVWEKLDPPTEVVKKQRVYDRVMLVRRMRALGFTLAEIGRRIGRSREQVRLIEAGYFRKGQFMRAPIEVWLESWKRMPWEYLRHQAEEEVEYEKMTAKRLAKAPHKTPFEIVEKRRARQLGKKLTPIGYWEQAGAQWVRIEWVSSWQQWDEGMDPKIEEKADVDDAGS